MSGWYSLPSREAIADTVRSCWRGIGSTRGDAVHVRQDRARHLLAALRWTSHGDVHRVPWGAIQEIPTSLSSMREFAGQVKLGGSAENSRDREGALPGGSCSMMGTANTGCLIEALDVATGCATMMATTSAPAWRGGGDWSSSVCARHHARKIVTRRAIENAWRWTWRWGLDQQRPASPRHRLRAGSAPPRRVRRVRSAFPSLQHQASAPTRGRLEAAGGIPRSCRSSVRCSPGRPDGHGATLARTSRRGGDRSRDVRTLAEPCTARRDRRPPGVWRGRGGGQQAGVRFRHMLAHEVRPVFECMEDAVRALLEDGCSGRRDRGAFRGPKAVPACGRCTDTSILVGWDWTRLRPGDGRPILGSRGAVHRPHLPEAARAPHRLRAGGDRIAYDIPIGVWI